MTTSTTRLIAIATLATLTLAANVAVAHGGKKGGGFNAGIGISGSFPGKPGNFNSFNNINKLQNQQCQTGGYNNGGYNNPNSQNYGGQAYEPFHSTYFVQPGDTFSKISLKEYRTSANARHIANFNRLAPNKALVSGQRLMLPSISANGKLSFSRAPAADNDPTAKLAQPGTSNTAADSGEPLPAVPAGSVLAIDGQEHGTDKGTVRLRIGTLALAVEVIEWTTNSAKVRLPELDLADAATAELEVLRADGRLASKTAIELTPATTPTALANRN